MNTQYKDFLRSRLLQLTLIVSIFGVGCVPKSKIVVTLKKNKISEPLNISVSHVQVINHQIIITGKNLDTVKSFQIKEGATDTSLQIESKNNTSIVANSISNVTFAAGRIFDFILSSASGASTFTVDFSLCDSTLGGKGFNCLMAPTDKQVLSYDIGTGKWRPRSVNGLAYQGTWSALTALPATGTLIPGDYYIVSVANAPYNVGDWIVLNNDGVTFEQIENSTAVTSVFARTGNIVGAENDYDLDQMGDVDLTTSLPIIGDALVFNGVKWVPGAVSGGGGGTVTAVSGTLPISVATGSSTPVVSISQATTTTNGYLSSTDWNIFKNKEAALPTGGTTLQYFRGDKTLGTLNTSVVPENTNLYFTNARALGLVLTGFDNTLTGQVAATDTMLQAFGRVQNQINSLSSGGSNYLIKNGPDTLSGAVSLTNVITATGTGDVVVNSVPLTMTSAVNKTYADGKLDKTAGGVVAGIVTLDNDLKVKGGTNYVTIKGHATSANYNLVLPSTAGTAGYVLSTDGSGNTSWISAAGGGAPSGAAGGDLSGTYPNPTITALDAAKVGGGAVSNTEFSYLDGVTSSIQTQLNAKLSAETDPSVTAFAKAALPTCTAGQVLKGDGTSLTCVTDNAGAGAYAGGNNFVIVTNGSGALSDSTITTTKLGYLSGVTSDIQTQLNAKQDTISKATTQDVSKIRIYGANATNYVELSAATLTGNRSLIFPDSDGTNGYVLSTNGAGVLSWIVIPSAPVTTVFGRSGVVVATAGDYTATQITNTPAGTIAATTTQAAINELDTEKQSIASLAGDVRSTVLTGLSTATNSVIAAADSVLVAFGKLQAQISGQATTISSQATLIGTKADTTNVTQTITALAVTGLAAPVADSDAANKLYVDGFGQWTKNGSDIYRGSGNVGIGTSAPGSALDVKGTLRLSGTTSGYVGFAPAAAAGSTTYTLPASDGSAGQILKTDGSGVLSWGTDNAGAGAFSGTVSRAVATDGAGALTTLTTTSTELGYVNGVTSSIQTQLNAKEPAITAGTTAQYIRGDKTLSTFANDIWATVLTGLSTATNSAITATDSILVAFGKLQAQVSAQSTASSNYLVKNGADTISGTVTLTNVITATGAGDVVVNSVPLTMTSAVNKTYADGKLDKTTGGTVAGIVTLDNDLKIKGGSNYVTLKGHATSANYNLILPSSAGTAGYVLSTDGSGNTSWISAAGGGAPTGAAGGDLSGTYPNPTITALDAAKVGGGAVSNTEFSYLDGVTSSIQTQLNAKEPTITAGTTTQYLRGDKSLSTFANDIWATVLTGLSTATNSAITAADSILVAFGKLQAQISGQATSIGNKADTTNIAQTITALAVTGLGAPVADSDAANKAYVDGKGMPSNSIAIYQVRVATTGNITLSGTQTIDDVALVVGDRVLAKNQSTVSENGVYVVSAGAWTRATDMDTWSEALGYQAQVSEGDILAGMSFSSAATLPGTIGTTDFRWNSTGSDDLDNVANGLDALGMNTDGYDNTAIGAYTLQLNTTGSENVATGAFALTENTVGYDNTAIGTYALDGNTTGYRNTATGLAALSGNLTGANNTALGYRSLYTNTTGSQNIGIGYNSGSAITTGSNNVIIGSNTGSTIATSSNHILISDGAGTERMRIDSTGKVGIGTTNPAHALDVYGDCISWMGTCINTTAPSNVVSYIASTLKFSSNTTQAISLTRWLGAHGTAPATTDVDGILVTKAGTLNNIYIKADANTNDAAIAFTIYKNLASTGVTVNMAAGTTTASDTASSITVAAGDRISVRVVTAGASGTLTRAMLSLDHMVTTNVFSSQWITSGTDISYSSGNVGIGTSTPTYQLQLSTDSAAKPGTSTWTIASDARLKDVRAPFSRGLDSILGINPIYYRYKKNNPLNLPSDKEYVGILAQNAKELIPESVSTDEQGFLHLNNDSIIWTLLNAVKELHQRFTTSSIKERREIASVSERTIKLEVENAAKDRKIKDLEKENADFKKRLVIIEKAMRLK